MQLDPTLDPRDWKREHRVALLYGAALGAFVCLVFAFMHTKGPYWDTYIWSHPQMWYSKSLVSSLIFYGDFRFIPWEGLSYLLGLIMWTSFGGVVGGSAVYITQLLRR
jgi:hypothetical protein